MSVLHITPMALAIPTFFLRVDVQVLALNINHPAGHLLSRPVHHDHYHVHGHN